MLFKLFTCSVKKHRHIVFTHMCEEKLLQKMKQPQ